jgi:sterol desaturase/sphingolipid hydroxylase (fatty acid hydroxylase superfamily)
VRAFDRRRRWPSNLAITTLNAVLVRLFLPAGVFGFALEAEKRGWGLMNIVAIPQVFAIAIAFVLLDLAIYLQHVMFHAVPALWRVHRMHHADLDFDVTTGNRFHPLEILLSLGLKLAIVAVLGPPAVAVLVFEVALNATSMFNHSNLRISESIDRGLRLLLVTPDMHRVHHSVAVNETNSNFGFNLPWWDRLFGTYLAQPEAGHEHMTIGIDLFREPGELRLQRMLLQPFRGEAGNYPITRRASSARTANREAARHVR